MIVSTKGTTSAGSAELASEQTRRAAKNYSSSQKKGQGAAGYGSVKGNENVYVRYGQLSTTGVAGKCGVIALGVGVNTLVCAFVSREKYWTSTATVHIMPALGAGGGAVRRHWRSRVIP